MRMIAFELVKPLYIFFLVLKLIPLMRSGGVAHLHASFTTALSQLEIEIVKEHKYVMLSVSSSASDGL